MFLRNLNKYYKLRKNMKEKRVVTILLFLIFLAVFIPVVFAEDNVDKAYTCLSGKVKDKCSGLTVEEQAFSLLALSYDSTIQGQCRSALMDKSKDQECWPKSACTLRETALAILALQNINADTSKPEKWLLAQNKTPDELTWYLEIDATEATTCKIGYDGRNYTVGMANDKKLDTGVGTCLALAQGNYWLQISQSCINKNFQVSCDKDFITALLYRKTGSDVWHVSSDTKSASSGGTTENQVNSLCFKQNNKCDYEGSLWATLALQKNQDIAPFLPYLIALASDNEKFNAQAFLYILMSSDEYLNAIRSKQISQGFWDLTSSYGRYYDTALSILGLSQQSMEEDSATKAKNWLLSVQGSDGCWSSIRDTAFILYAAWPRTPIQIIGVDIDYCEDYGKYCLSRTDCLDEAKGEILENYACKENSLKICCSKNIIEKPCSEKDGIICNDDESCDGDLVSASDSNKCCKGDCKKQEASECEDASYTCKSSQCSDTEESKSLSCPDDGFCCAPKLQTSGSYWWLWLLIILIALVVLAIIFRNRLRLLLFQFKNKFRKGPVIGTRPPFPPSSGQARPMPRFLPQARQMPSQVRRPASRTDKELDDTMRKLREMSK